MFRIAAVIPLFLVVAIIMGKRHLAELSVFDFIIAMTMGSIAGADIADPEIQHGPTLFAITVVGLVHVVISRIILKHRRFGRWVTLDPTIVMQNGVILKDNLELVRYSVDELLYHLREKDVFDLNDVEYAVLEPSGSLSVLKKSDAKSVTVKDMGLTTASKGLSLPVVLEGKLHDKGIEALGLTREHVMGQIRQWGYNEPEEVFLAMINEKGETYVSPNAPSSPPKRLDH